MPIVNNLKREEEQQIINKKNGQQKERNKKSKNLSRLSNLDVSEFMVENNIKSETGLFTIADEQKKAGKKDLAKFVLSRPVKALTDLLENTWKMESASIKVFCSKQTPAEVIREHSHGRCADFCSREWLNCASQVLQENNIYLPYFSTAVLIFS